MNCPFPVSSLWSSKRLTGLPEPKRILPGRIFISLSFELIVGLGGVLAGFGDETTRSRRDEVMRFMQLASQSGDIPQGLLDHLALVSRQRRLRRDGGADRVAPDVEPGRYAGRPVETRKRFVDGPPPAPEEQSHLP